MQHPTLRLATTQKFKKSYMDEKYGVEEAEKIRRVGQVDAATVCQTKISQCRKWLTKEREARSLVKVGRSCGW
jgi:hypothetical protein